MATSCTRPAALSNISKQDCAIDFLQIQRGIIQRLGTPFGTEALMKDEASWTALLQAADNTKIVLTPYMFNFVIPAAEAGFINEGDNNSLGGMGFYTGLNAVKPTGNFVGLESAIWSQLQQLSPESAAELGIERLGIYLINERGQILHKNLGPIPLSNFFVASPGSEGFKAKTLTPFGFTLKGDWFDGVQLLTPSFDPRTALD